MAHLRRIAALLLVALWLPATLHCDLEAAGLENWFSCHDEVAHAADHCADDLCHPLEDSVYKSDTAPLKVPAPVLTLAADFSAIALVPSALAATRLLPVYAPSPPDFPRPWPFLERAALPARAPDRLT